MSAKEKGVKGRNLCGSPVDLKEENLGAAGDACNLSEGWTAWFVVLTGNHSASHPKFGSFCGLVPQLLK